mmetsp:Transcript_5946/g.10677  ORF Transcript_5946/g.10677 Transcript_5946/m.10677 type:complete len:138 (-) Transcript_5946:122-535(-)
MSKRLTKELETLRSKTLEADGLRLESSGDLQEFSVLMQGPSDSAYAKGLFRLVVAPGNYPMTAPDVRFVTQMFHPNISDKDGRICIDMLIDQWSPILTIEKALVSIRSLLTDANPDHGLNDTALEMYRRDRSAFDLC